MEVLKAICIYVLCISSIQTYPSELERLSRQLPGCPAPDVQIADDTLVPSNDFPRNDYMTALQNHPDRAEIEALIEREKAELGKIAKLENAYYLEYDDCKVPMCDMESSVIEQWRVQGKNCWSIQPIIWRNCGEIPLDDFSCIDEADKEGLGFTCRSDYTPQKILVYCQQPKTPFLNMTVYASFKCSIKWYNCVERN